MLKQDQKIKSVVIVDDSPLMQQVLSSIFSESGRFDVVGVAGDPIEAREIIRKANPDVITLDVEMPRMDGISFLEKIMRLKPTPTVMISSLTTEGADVTLQALELGAVECVAKPTGSIKESFMAAKDQLVNIVYAAANARVTSLPRASAEVLTDQKPRENKIDIIGIGASTGGVAALHDIFPSFPIDMPPIVIVQHMPELFVPRFTDRLNANTSVKVSVAKDSELLKNGHAYVAPGSHHLEIIRKGNQYQARLLDTAPVSGHKPSIDVLFQSLSVAAADKALGVILTGMGKDGASGMKYMFDKGARTLGQNAVSSTVYGMNKVAFEMGAVEDEVDIHKMAATIMAIL